MTVPMGVLVCFVSAIALLDGAEPQKDAARKAPPVSEEAITHAGVKFRIVRVDAGRLQLVWKDAHGRPYRTFDKVQAALAAQGKTVSFIMNAGIFEPGGIPSGLHMSDGIQYQKTNQAEGEGNFFLKPNGIFWTERSSTTAAFISTAEKFNTRVESSGPDSTRRMGIGVQSSPLLLLGGKRHTAFKENSASKLHRNGVGIDAGGQVIFAITAPGEFVNFWDFAGLFLKLDCRDALFLDGVISQMNVNPTTPVRSNPFGAIFVVAD